MSQKPESYKELKEALGKLEESTEKLKAEIEVDFRGELVVNEWCKGEIEVRNAGEINVEDVEIKVESDVVEIKGMKTIAMLKPGEAKEIPVRIKSRDAGYVPVEAKIRYKNMLSDKVEEKTIGPEIYVKKEKGPVPVPVVPPLPPVVITLEIVKKYLGEKYEIIALIGSGGTADVYECKKKSDNTIVALKVMREWYIKPEVRSGFIDEVGKWNEVLRHNNINVVQVNWCDTEPFGYIEMEFLECVEKKMPFSWQEAARIMMDVASALYTAHKEVSREPVLHMDVKPSNIFVDKGNGKLGDWGLAQRKYREGIEKIGGTLVYAAPEVLEGRTRDIDARADIYSWGATFYYLITGRQPFSGANVGEIIESKKKGAPDPKEHVPDLPEELRQLLMDCMSYEMSERPANAIQLITTLSKLLNEPVDIHIGFSTLYIGDLLKDATLMNDCDRVKHYLEAAQGKARTTELKNEIRKAITELERLSPEGFRYADETKSRILNIAERLSRGG